MRHKRSRFSTKSEINIVPLLDVLLVLVLIFMATAPIISQSVEVDLPEATETETVSSEDNSPVIVEVSDIGIYTLIYKQQRTENLPEEEVLAEIKSLIEKDEKVLFLIGGAKHVPYEEIIKALNILRAAGVKSVGLMTQPL